MTLFADHFSGVAGCYSAFRPGYPPALFDWLATLPAGRGLAWDCGCGSGQASRPLAERFDRVVATDASAAQVAAAPGRDNVVYAVAPAGRPPLADGAVDLVTVAQALHWFAGEPFFAEVRRVLSPQGVFAAWTYDLPRLPRGVEELVVRFHWETVGPFWPPERRLVVEGYSSIELPFSELETPVFEMTLEWTLPQLLGFLRSWSATGRYIAAHGEDPVEALSAELGPLWGDPEHRERITWPLTVRAGGPGR